MKEWKQTKISKLFGQNDPYDDYKNNSWLFFLGLSLTKFK